MNCDGAFCIASGSAGAGLQRIREELAMGAHLRATNLYAVGWFDPDHDAVMRIGGKAPGGGSILSVGIKCQVRIRHPATSDLNSAVVLKTRARRMVLSANPFRTLDVRRRRPVVHQ